MEKQTFNERLKSYSFPFRIAKRYLFSKKSHNAINIISAISAIGVCIATIALVSVLSVLNGFESLVSSLFSAFDSDLKITLVEGKTFDISSDEFGQIRNNPAIINFTEVIEENALLRFKEKQMPAVVKGVSDEFSTMTKIDSIMYDGKFELFDGAFERSVPGLGVASMLGVTPYFIDPLYIYAPKRTSRVNLLRPETSFNQVGTFVSGIFSVQQLQYDDNYLIVSLNLARDLFEYDSVTVSAIELKIDEKYNQAAIQKEIRQLLGEKFNVKNRYEQQESFYSIMRIEKWITFFILCFILLIASFNIIGSLSMLIIDKKDDIRTLNDLGANSVLIKRIFLFEGWMISLVGAITGIVLGTLLCLIQTHFGILKLGMGYIVEAYPVLVKPTDILLVFIVVLLLGFLSAYYPTRYIKITTNDD